MRLFAAFWGLIIWVSIGLISGKPEAWDAATLYLAAGLPALLAGSAAFGYRAAAKSPNSKPFKLGLWVAFGHGIGAFVSGLLQGSGFSLWPLTFIVMAMIGLPCVACAALGSWIRKARQPIR